MRAATFAAAIFILAAGNACSKKKGVDSAAAPGTFGAACTVDSDCTSRACFPDQQGPYCSLRCEKDDDCSAPASGKCNRKGYCKR